MKIAYGYTAEPFKNDVLIDMAGDAMDKFARAGVPGAFMVDMMPFCEYSYAINEHTFTMLCGHNLTSDNYQ